MWNAGGGRQFVSPRRERAFVLQWRSAVLNSTQSPAEKLVLLTLAEFADDKGEQCFPSIVTVAALARVNERTVRRTLNAASETAWLARWTRKRPAGAGRAWRGDSYAYRLTLPQGADITPARRRFAPGMVPGAEPSRPGQIEREARTTAPPGAGVMSTELGRATREEQQGEEREHAPAPVRPRKQPLPEGFEMSDGVRTWAEDNGYEYLEERVEAFCLKVQAHGYQYADWDAALKTAIREDWAGLSDDTY